MKSVFALVALSCAAALAADTVPVPKITALPVTADSRPFGGADHSLAPLDLAKLGYTEEEYIVSGDANVYDWSENGSVSVKTPNAPYADRILVRRPSNPSRFSGTVIVELTNAARRFDWAMMWGYSHDYFMEHGDAWVGITMPGAVEGLQKFNPTRYAALSFKNPTPDAVCAGGGGRGKGKAAGPSESEEGLRWDMFSQVAAALKNNAPGMPMAGYKVDAVFMTTQAGDIVTYINAIHPHARLANGKPAYDGYLIKNAPSAVRISQCSPNIPRGDARAVVHNIDVPVMAVVAQGEVAANLAFRKPDSDDPSGRFRLYEIAGAAHIDKHPYDALPSFPDQIAAAGSAQGSPDWPFNAQCTPPIPLSNQPLLKYSYDAAFANLDKWVHKGTSPPHAERIKVKEGEKPALELDEAGNGIGGVRNPYVDAPVATYFTTTPGPGTCAELGHAVPLASDKIQSRYPNAKTYQSKVSQSVDRMRKEGFLTESDAKKLKAELTEPAAATR